MAETVNALPRPREADSHGRISDWPGWDYVPGIAFLVIGALALAEPPLASLAAGIYLGAMICIAGKTMPVKVINPAPARKSVRRSQRGAMKPVINVNAAVPSSEALATSPICCGEKPIADR